MALGTDRSQNKVWFILQYLHNDSKDGSFTRISADSKTVLKSWKKKLKSSGILVPKKLCWMSAQKFSLNQIEKNRTA